MPGAFISATLHVAILLWGGGRCGRRRRWYAPVLLEIPVDVLLLTELTNLKAGVVEEKDEAPLAGRRRRRRSEKGRRRARARGAGDSRPPAPKPEGEAGEEAKEPVKTEKGGTGEEAQAEEVWPKKAEEKSPTKLKLGDEDRDEAQLQHRPHRRAAEQGARRRARAERERAWSTRVRGHGSQTARR